MAKGRGPTPEEVQAANRCAFWKPWPHQQRVLDLLHAGKKVILFQGANRIGKSCLAANVAISAVAGSQPWDGRDVTKVFGKPPVKIRYLATDWEHAAREVAVPAFYHWFPKGLFTTRKNNTGVEAYWEFGNGSTIEILTHIQETKIHEGWEGNLVIADEPLPRDKYVANRRGLVDRSGVFLLTMTAVYEPWIMDEIALNPAPHIGVVEGVPMRANPLLQQADIDNYVADVPLDQREARIEGGWFQLAGKVWKTFQVDKHRVRDFTVPTDWPIVTMIDIHLNTPQAVGFYGFDPYDRIFGVGEIWENCGPEELGHKIIKEKRTNGWRMEEAFIDPLSKGDSAFVKNRFGLVEDTYTILERILAPEGIRLHTASKDKVSGIRNVDARLTGPNGMPTLFFQDKCERHVWEIMRWVYDPKTNKPRDADDHMCENLYRVTLTGVKYTKPGIFGEPLVYKPTGVV